jgi:WD40 repeat protein
VIGAPKEGVWPAVFAPVGSLLTTGNGDGSVSFWDTQSGKQRGYIAPNSAVPTFLCLSFARDGKLLAGGGLARQGSTSVVQVWQVGKITEPNGDVVTSEKCTLEGHGSGCIYCVAFSPNGKLLASSGQDQTVKVWNIDRGKLVKTLTAHEDFVYSVVFSPDGKLLASLGRDAVKMWSVK